MVSAEPTSATFNIRETAGWSADAFPSSNGRPRPRTRTTDDYVREREIT
jgi:hypothetical protein